MTQSVAVPSVTVKVTAPVPSYSPAVSVRDWPAVTEIDVTSIDWFASARVTVAGELVAEVYVASAAMDAVTTHVPALDDVNVPALAVHPVAVPLTALYVIAPLPV
jgi:hypothetical protein